MLTKQVFSHKAQVAHGCSKTQIDSCDQFDVKYIGNINGGRIATLANGPYALAAAYCEDVIIGISQNGQVIKSDDDGLTFKQIYLDKYGTSTGQQRTHPFIFYGGNGRFISAHGNVYVYVSNDYGETWVKKQPFPSNAIKPVKCGFQYPDTGRVLLFKRGTLTISDDFLSSTHDVPIADYQRINAVASAAIDYNPTTGRTLKSFDASGQGVTNWPVGPMLIYSDNQGDTWTKVTGKFNASWANTHDDQNHQLVVNTSYIPFINWIQDKTWILVYVHIVEGISGRDLTGLNFNGHKTIISWYSSNDDGVNWNLLFEEDANSNSVAWSSNNSRSVYLNTPTAIYFLNPQNKGDKIASFNNTGPFNLANLKSFDFKKHSLDKGKVRFDANSAQMTLATNGLLVSYTYTPPSTYGISGIARLTPSLPPSTQITPGTPGTYNGKYPASLFDLKKNAAIGNRAYTSPAWAVNNFVMTNNGEAAHWDGVWMPFRLTNLLVGATATSTAGSYGTALAIDNNPSTRWTSASDSTNDSVFEIDFTVPYTVTFIEMKHKANYGATEGVDITFEYWDGVGWAPMQGSSVLNHPSIMGPNQISHVIPTPPVTTDKIRFKMHPHAKQYLGFQEIRVLGV